MSNDALAVQTESNAQSQGAGTLPLRRRSRIEGALFMLPAGLFQLTWGWYPLIMAFFLSFTNARMVGELEFTGLESYTRVWRDPLAWQSFQVTLIYAFMSILLTFVLPIIVAILLMEMPPKAMRWMMLLWFLPISSIASTTLWQYIYNNQIGLFQYIATQVLHLPTQEFLNSSSQVLFWLIFPGLLLFGPGLVYMASLQSIPASYYEAAEVEGASFWRKVWTVSLPRLRPMIAMMLTFAIIGTLQEFQWPQLMTGGQPGGASRTVVMYMYSMINNLQYANATALSVFLFIVIMTLTIVFRTVFREDPDQ